MTKFTCSTDDVLQGSYGLEDSELDNNEKEDGKESTDEEGNEEDKREEEETHEDACNQKREDISLSADTIQKLACELAKALKMEETKEGEEVKEMEFWVAGDEHWICRPCVRYSQDTTVPKKLENSRRGIQGVIRRKQKSWHIRQAKLQHEANSLHVWCLAKETNDANTKQNHDDRNRLVGEQTIRNLILCYKRSWSSEDFMALNDLQHLTPGMEVAVKNCSSTSFFRVRDIVMEVLTEKFQKLFQIEIENFCITLDKVTIFNTSFTILCTYYFMDGCIYIIHNELFVMDVDDYCSEGCARKVVEVLCRTLGISSARVAKALRHATYDGVYATTEERTGGGGSLNLIHWLCWTFLLTASRANGTMLIYFR